jgi:hypothetical protein
MPTPAATNGGHITESGICAVFSRIRLVSVRTRTCTPLFSVRAAGGLEVATSPTVTDSHNLRHSGRYCHESVNNASATSAATDMSATATATSYY